MKELQKGVLRRRRGGRMGGGAALQSLVFSPLSLLFVALFGGCGYFCMLQPPDQLMGEL